VSEGRRCRAVGEVMSVDVGAERRPEPGELENDVKCLVKVSRQVRRALVRTASPVAFEDRIWDLISCNEVRGGLRWINVSGCGAGHQGTHGIQS